MLKNPRGALQELPETAGQFQRGGDSALAWGSCASRLGGLKHTVVRDTLVAPLKP